MRSDRSESPDGATELGHDEIIEVLEIVRDSDLEYFELRIGDLVIIASSGARPDGLPAVSVAAGTSTAVAPTDRPVEPSTIRSAAGRSTSASPGSEYPTPQESDEIIEIVAPVVGLFYTAPRPGATPFVGVGELIEEGSTLGLVEVMKMFNSVTAPHTGMIVDVLADDGAFVEFNQPLFRMKRL